MEYYEKQNRGKSSVILQSYITVSKIWSFIRN